MKRLVLSFCVSFFVVLSAVSAGCGSIPTEQSQPMTFEKRLKFAQDQAANILKACKSLVDAGRMSADEAQQCLDFVDEAKAAIDAARAMSGGDQTSRLMAIQEALLRVEAFLQARQA